MIDVPTAAELLNFGARIGEGARAQEQLEGAVAIHHLLETERVAYLADEVGMGKTYVALGALALFRHYDPNFRVLIIAPRENIQAKWMKELRNFVSNNVRFNDMRVKALDGGPTRALVSCGNLLELVREATLDPNRDFFARLTSFSLPVSGRDLVDPAAARQIREGLRSHLPWLPDEIFDLRNKHAFKDNVARAICCALPPFDLVIIDEGHNLKHGFGESVSARNRVLGLAMGHQDSATNLKLFPGFGPRARRVLFLSATPVDESYRHLWNQLDVFGFARPYEGLIRADVDDADKKAIAGQFLIRRVTSLRVGNVEHTKNLYRREWRRGGVQTFDEPIRIEDDRQRLIVALVQKKVSELLGHERFNSSFQIGMLASFESFLETAKLKREETEESIFDDTDQTDDVLEKEGIDVSDINRLTRSYRKKFGSEMPHPKMDTMVDSLSTSWRQGKKALVFVRRVASVKELKRKLDERYDQWLMKRLLDELPSSLHRRLKDLFKQYQDEKLAADSRDQLSDINKPKRAGENSDQGGQDTFFAWFFRGDGPEGVVSGANIQQRFIRRGAAYATFFEDNYVADALGCRPEEVQQRLAAALNVSVDNLRLSLRERSKRFLSRAKRHPRADRFEAVQAAAIEWLKDHPGPLQKDCRIIWHERFETSLKLNSTDEAPDIGDWLELATFFTELRERSVLRERLWPTPSHTDFRAAFRERELRAQLLASAARLGHSLIDLYVMTISRLGNLELRAQEATDDDGSDRDVSRIQEYLELLERQMQRGRSDCEESNHQGSDAEWGAFDELAEIAANFELILDVNEPEARNKPLSKTATIFGQLLRQQQPIGGMAGQVNQTLVRQFRMPGYPLVLVTTDLLQEGEDLHTFCSSVYHYGISWTPSAMEQRIGRIDRVRSQSDRRLAAMAAEALSDENKLQVYFPHLEDTVEFLQVQRVLGRMNNFLRLMHEGLITPEREQRTINADQEFAKTRRVVPQIVEKLESAFPVRPQHLEGTTQCLAASTSLAEENRLRLESLAASSLLGVDISWEEQPPPGSLLGTAILKNRVQPFTLLLRSIGSHAVIRCVSPVGCVSPGSDQSHVRDSATTAPIKIGAIVAREDLTYDLTVEGDVVLAATPETDAIRVGMLVQRIVQQADLLEQEHLPGHDEGLETFRHELIDEGTHDR